MALDLGGVKTHVAAAANEIAPMFGIRDVGGWRAIGSVPDSDHPKGLALDFMTTDQSKGDAIVAYAIANANRLGIKYVIWDRRIWEESNGWQSKAYFGPSPHTNHVHISFFSKPGTGTVSPVGNLPGIGDLPIFAQLNDFAAMLQDPVRWRRVGVYLLGVALLFFGLIYMFRRPIGNAVNAAVEIAPQGKAIKKAVK